ncbi:MAG: hypothetical protein NT917_19230 [Microcystis aeruginosa WS75]|jgi:hypothetical protein|nr:hypothetical protein [Microcystis aeruginosa WS75]NCS54439.1 hypothetical protein [Microcystis aeruginosa G13-05]
MSEPVTLEDIYQLCCAGETFFVFAEAVILFSSFSKDSGIFVQLINW